MEEPRGGEGGRERCVCGRGSAPAGEAAPAGSLGDTIERHVDSGAVRGIWGGSSWTTCATFPDACFFVLQMFDDDIEEVQVKVSEQKLGRVEDLEREIFIRGFEECEKVGAKTFGIYAASNAFFMKDRVYNDICYIIASMFGVIVEHDDFLARVTNHGEDYEYSIRQYIKNGVLARLDNYTVKSRYYKEEGGLQDVRTKEYVYDSVKIIADEFPELCTMYIRETTGHAELKLHDRNKKYRKVESSLADLF